MVWIVKDGCGIVCIVLAWSLMAFSQYGLLKLILLPKEDSIQKYVYIIAFEALFFLAFASHLKAIFTDPGTVPRRTATPQLMQEISLNSPPNYVVYKCAECCSVKPDRAHHCSVCKRCIRKMDHHCPWINNCVGERNQKYFVLFTFYVSALSFVTLILTVGNFLVCLEADWNSNPACPVLNKAGKPEPTNLITLVFLSFAAILFALFTLIMFCLQAKAIWSDWTGIENLKKESRDRRSGCTNLKSVFGKHVLLWCSPFTTPPEKIESSVVDEASSSVTCPV